MNELNNQILNRDKAEYRKSKFRKWWQQSGIITTSVLHRFDASPPVGASIQDLQNERPAHTGLNSEQSSRSAYFAAYPEAAYQHPQEAAELQDLLIRTRRWKP